MKRRSYKWPITMAILGLALPCVALAELPLQATFIGSSACADCHGDMNEAMAATIHWRLGEHEADVEQMCEACHGPGSEHAESEGKVAIARPFSGDDLASQVEEGCVGCHVGGATMEWPASEHAAAGLLCTECHNVKEAYRPADLTSSDSNCSQCHADQFAYFDLPSRHPLLEGKMHCVDCHDPHGAEESMLKAGTVNDLCYSCHAEMEGPFLYEHEPVMEDCLSCHHAKGAVNNNLLKLDEATLCLGCHAGHEDVHPQLTSATARAGYMTRCTRCHSQIHGSDQSGFVGPSRFVR